jgi:hypothetical protein
LSSENLEHDGIYLLENGEDALLYVNLQASREVLHQLFGVHSVDELVVGQVQHLLALLAFYGSFDTLSKHAQLFLHSLSNFIVYHVIFSFK